MLQKVVQRRCKNYGKVGPINHEKANVTTEVSTGQNKKKADNSLHLRTMNLYVE